jgi:hypothetical protein
LVAAAATGDMVAPRADPAAADKARRRQQAVKTGIFPPPAP